MPDPDPFFRKVWLIALEKSIAEGRVSQECLLRVKRQDADMEALPVTHISSSTSVDPSTSDSAELSTSTSQESDDIFAGMVGNEKFQRWKAEVIHKGAVLKLLLAKEEFSMGNHAPSLGSNTIPLPGTNPASGSVKVSTNHITGLPAIHPPTDRGNQNPLGSGDPFLSYIQSRERHLMFSSSRTPARHSSEVRGPVRWMKVNLGNYSTFELADDRFHNAGKPRPWNPEKGARNYPYPRNRCQVDRSW
ncbi:hypothetical protein C7212DRAFT_344608 [Tuber magnatum]|uniref:Uncharacterized protein n=1 Tax=Tuber magnatum TaxID=42249 RepID=A0A317SSR2_9PEZI|nr:hypothetical protein C7212DRAFT_344608 [Tuber magnatum]